VLVRELLLVSAAVKEKQAIVCSIEIRTKGNSLVQLADSILVSLLILVEDTEFEMSLVECGGRRQSLFSATPRRWADPQRFHLQSGATGTWHSSKSPVRCRDRVGRFFCRRSRISGILAGEAVLTLPRN